MKKGEVIPALLFVLDPDFTEIVEPRMRDFHDPSSRFAVRMFPIRFVLLFRKVLAPRTDVRHVSGGNGRVADFGSDVSGVEAKVLSD